MADNMVKHIAAYLEPFECTKNSFLLKQAHISNNYFFLETGLMRAITYDTEGN